MDLKQINKRYTLQKNIFDAFLKGVSSNLITYRNGIIFLEVKTGKKNRNTIESISCEIAHSWKRSITEFSHALGCKMYFTDISGDPLNEMHNGSEIKPGYTAKKGILFFSSQLN